MVGVSNKDSLSFNYSIKSEPFITLLNFFQTKEICLAIQFPFKYFPFVSETRILSIRKFFYIFFLKERQRGKIITDPNNINT